MPLVFLKYPLVKHYAGSVFDIEEVVRPNESHPILYERMTPRRYYFLPDDGKGRPMDLSYDDVEACPAGIFKKVLINTGPVRITSVIAGGPDQEAHRNTNYLHPELFDLEPSEGIEKQIIKVIWPPQVHLPLNGIFFDRKLNKPIGEAMLTQPNFDFDLLKLHPGFYEIQLLKEQKILFRITMIKCFPLVVSVDASGQNYAIQKTVW